VTCHNCRIDCRKFGKREGRQRYQCQQCRKVFTDARDNTLDGMYLPVEKAELVLSLLLEGNSVSSVERITGIHHGTILKLLVLAGEKAERIMAEKVVSVPVRDVEADEVWSFVGKKQKRIRRRSLTALLASPNSLRVYRTPQDGEKRYSLPK
jgi:transposase-like protein